MTFAHKVSRTMYGMTTKQGLQRLTVLGVLILLLAAVVGVYHWYSVRQTEYAQADLALCLEELEKARHSDDAHDWQEVEQSCQAGFQRHAASAMAPYFLACQAEALLEQGHHDAALKKMQEALVKFSSKSPLYHVYALKEALMMIDAAQAEIRQEGVKKLQELAQDAKNPQQDMALLYLGHYYSAEKDTDNAVKTWTKLVQEHGANSLWALKAQGYLDTVCR